MKKLFTLLVVALFSVSVVNAQQEPTSEKPATEKKCCKKDKKKSCSESDKKTCSKDKKECSKSEKKSCSQDKKQCSKSEKKSCNK